MGSVRTPASELGGVVQAAEEQRLGGARGAHGADQALHARGLERRSAPLCGHPAAVQPAAPIDLERLVVKIEDQVMIGLEGPCHRAPERGCVIPIGHRQLGTGGGVARRSQMEVQDHEQVGPVQRPDVGGDDAAIGLPTPARAGPDAQPAVLVQRNPDDVDVPALHGRDHRPAVDLVRVWAVEEPPALNTGVFESRAVDAPELHDPTAARTDDKLVAADAQARRGGVRARRRPRQRQRNHQHNHQHDQRRPQPSGRGHTRAAHHAAGDTSPST